MKKKYLKPQMMVQTVGQMILLAGSNPAGFRESMDDSPVDGPSALSRGNSFTGCWGNDE